MSWKKYTILSISIACILLFGKYAYSCISEAVYYAFPSFFGNKAPGKVAYRPFFYVSGAPYYDNYEDKNQDSLDLLNIANLKEWQSYTGEAIPLKDIDSLVNKYSLNDLHAILSGKTGLLSAEEKKNVFGNWLVKNKVNGAGDYLIYAAKSV